MSHVQGPLLRFPEELYEQWIIDMLFNKFHYIIRLVWNISVKVNKYTIYCFHKKKRMNYSIDFFLEILQFRKADE